MASAGIIDDYVTELSRALRGPRGAKLDLVTEARDSLVDTAEALEGEGLERAEAERIAVAEFGPISEIAPGYQEDLSISAGRRLAALLFVSVPLTALLWSVIWQIFPIDPVDYATKPGWFVPIARSVDILQMFTGVLGGIALLALGRGLRRIRRPRLVTRGLAVFVWAVFPVMLVLCAALVYGSHGPTGFSGYPLGVGVSLVSYGFMLAQLYGATRCLSITRREPVTA
ncbi:permease prefix domain 1-containing protein [Streptosporangium sp. NBC_01639]|uniref:permease prefix domain 1-containing protein n=1 Tax=Streptosporangium sp. NBC_01639 TaxID=2975948 RepID=UPI00386A90FD|nr:permease prefix domain 1-containing protein [Streptosporangium sp. NBC_01639]